MRSLIIFAILALIVAGVVPRYNASTNGATAAAPAALRARPEPVSSSSGYRSMTIERGADGHFQVDAVVEGRRMDFLIDTGATAITLRESDAARLGIHPSQRDYTLRFQTANGVVRAAPVELNRVEVGSLTVHNVRAIVLPDESLGQNLLGMTFLSRVRWEHREGRLVLEQ